MNSTVPHIQTTLPRPREGVLSIAPYQQGKSKAASGVKLIKLSSNENPLGPSPKAIQAFQSAAVSLHRYPDGAAASLREAIAKAYALDPARIVCGAGSDELIGLLIHAYASDGDEVLYSQHGFLMYKIYALGFGARPVSAPEKEMRTDVDALLSAVTPRTKIVFVANPNNPTGSYITAVELKQLRDGLPSHVILVVDAAYAEYVEEQNYSDGLSLASTTENTVMLRTFSKIHGLSGLRLGWAYCPAAIGDVLNRLRSPFNVSTPAMLAGIAAIEDDDYIARTRRFNKHWLEYLIKEISVLGLHVHPTVANFVLVEFENAATAARANDFLMERGIIPRDVSAYGLEKCLRVSVGLEDENNAVVRALGQFLRR